MLMNELLQWWILSGLMVLDIIGISKDEPIVLWECGMDGVSEDEAMDELIVLWEGGMEGGVSAITIAWDDT